MTERNADSAARPRVLERCRNRKQLLINRGRPDGSRTRNCARAAAAGIERIVCVPLRRAPGLISSEPANPVRDGRRSLPGGWSGATPVEGFVLCSSRLPEKRVSWSSVSLPVASMPPEFGHNS